MLLHESPLHNQKLQQDIDLEGKDGLTPCVYRPPEYQDFHGAK